MLLGLKRVSALKPMNSLLRSKKTSNGPSGANIANLQMVFIRHGEKPSDAKFIGLDQQGWDRAFRLPNFFLPAGSPTFLTHTDFNGIKIFALQQHIHDTTTMQAGSRRPIETVQPFADGLGVAINDSFKKEKTPGDKSKFLDLLLSGSYANQTVVVCWEHKDLALIVTAFAAKLGIQEPVPNVTFYWDTPGANAQQPNPKSHFGFSKTIVFNFDANGNKKNVELRDQDDSAFLLTY